MKKIKYIFVAFIICISFIAFVGCSDKESLSEPSEGVLFAIDPESATPFEEYELNLKASDGSFVVVTLKKNENYRVKWDQILVDKQNEKSYEVHTLQGYNTREPGDLTEYADPFMLTFENGTTNLGRLVKITLY